jgi:DNA invertase Pin-like site-specific DNA recombinase
MPPQVEHLRRLLSAAQAAGIDTHLLRAASKELIALIESHDGRKLETSDLYRRIRRARTSGSTRQQILERFKISVSTYHRAVAPPSDIFAEDSLHLPAKESSK